MQAYRFSKVSDLPEDQSVVVKLGSITQIGTLYKGEGRYSVHGDNVRIAFSDEEVWLVTDVKGFPTIFLYRANIETFPGTIS